MYISYERYSYVAKNDKNLRITFDTNIIYRDNDLCLDKGDYGDQLINENVYILEVKTLGSMPIWFTNALTELKIYPTSFSKYGKIYQLKIMKNNLVKVS